MRLKRQVLNFLELEVFAAELYRQHKKHVPKELVPIMREFQDVEETHVARFSDLYRIISGEKVPRCLFSRWTARFAAYLIAPFGWRYIFRFECWVEKKAVEDYRKAMQWVKHKEVHHAIQATLADEERHAPYLETLKRFCHEEETHIKKMTSILKTSR